MAGVKGKTGLAKKPGNGGHNKQPGPRLQLNLKLSKELCAALQERLETERGVPVSIDQVRDVAKELGYKAINAWAYPKDKNEAFIF